MCEENLQMDPSHKGPVIQKGFPYYDNSMAHQISLVSGNALAQKIALTHYLYW